MANTKITELTQLTNPVSTDVLPIVDVAADVTKKISIADLLKNASAGTAAAPGIAFDGDNAGIYSPGADQVAISTNGTGRLFVDASGNIGVGYASPSNFAGGDLGATAPLVVGDGTGSRNVNIFSANNNYGHLAFSDGTSGSSTYAGLIQYYHVNDSMAFYTGSSQRMLIDSSGRLGLGTSSPLGKLHVDNGASDSFTYLQARGANGLESTLAFLTKTSGGGFSGASIGHDGSTNTLYLTGATTGGSTQHVSIDSLGRVGIGTTTPSAQLHVQSTTGSSVFRISNGDATINARLQANAGDGSVNLFNESNYSLTFGTNNTERARITSDGKLGLGTTSPGGALHCVTGVNGNVNIYQTNVTGSWNSGDYVNVNLGVNNQATGTIRVTQEASSASSYASSMGFWTRVSNTHAERMRIDSSGRVGIGTTTIVDTLEVRSANGAGLTIGRINITGASSEPGYINFRAPNASGTEKIWAQILPIIADATDGSEDANLVFRNIKAGSTTERARIDSSGRLLVNTSSARSDFSAGTLVQLEGAGSGAARYAAISNNNLAADGAGFYFARSRGTSNGSNTIVLNNDTLGGLFFHGADGTDLASRAGSIECQVDGTPGANDMPGRLVFSTTVGGSASPTERMRITSDAYVRLASGTGGIQFNGDTAAANALDDYEEGTFTPTVIGLTTAGTGTYTLQTGTYTKIGNRVCFQTRMTWTAHTGTGDMAVAGLPFTSAITSNGQHAVSIQCSRLTFTASSVIQGSVNINATTVALSSYSVGGGVSSPIPVVSDPSGTQLLIAGTYRV